MVGALILALLIPAAEGLAGAQIAAPRSTPRDAASDPGNGIKSSGTVRGRITSVDTGKPLRRAQIRLVSEDDVLGTPRTTSTSSDGRYEFRDVAPGRYTL